MKINRLDWDSDFFNIEIGEVIFDGELFDADDVQGFDLLYVKSTSDYNLTIDGFEQSYQETKFIFSTKNITNLMDDDDCITSIKDTKLTPDNLYELAYLSGVDSRFNKDYNFTTAQFKALYRTWIDNSIEANYAEDVLVYIKNGEVKGFVTYNIKEKVANIGLIAVDVNSQGSGIGKSLIHQAMNRLKGKSVSELCIPTQKENINACNFYKKLGFAISSLQVIKHFWKQ